MPRGKYQIGEPVSPTKDSSFGSCICTLLVFLVICIICILASYPWKKSSKPEYVKIDHSSERLHGENNYEDFTKQTHSTENIEDNTASTAPSIQHLTTKKIDTDTEASGTTFPTTTTESIDTTPSINIRANENEKKSETVETQTNLSVLKLKKTKITQQHIDTIDQDVEQFEDTNQNRLGKLKQQSTTEANREELSEIEDLIGPKKVKESNENVITDVENRTEITTQITTTEDTVSSPDSHYSTKNETSTNVTDNYYIKNLITYPSSTTVNKETTPNISDIEDTVNSTTVTYSKENEEKSATTKVTDNYYKTNLITYPSSSIVNEETTPNISDIEDTVYIHSTTVIYSQENEEKSTEVPDRETSANLGTTEINTEPTTQQIDEKSEFTTAQTEILIFSTTETYFLNQTEEIQKETTYQDSITENTQPTTEQTTTEQTTTETSDLDSLKINLNYPTKEENNETTKITTTTTLARTSRDINENKQTTSLPITSLFKKAPVCTSQGCKSIAARILSKMNHSVDPCDDFYEYACGGNNFDNAQDENWKRIITKYKTINVTSPNYLKLFKNISDNCICFHEDYDYEDRVLKATNILNSFGKFINKSQPVSTEMNTELLAKLLLVDISPFFDISFDIHKEQKTFVFKMDPRKKSSLLRLDETDPAKKKCFKKQIKNYEITDLNDAYEKFINCSYFHLDYLDIMTKAIKVFGVVDEMDDFSWRQFIRKLRFTVEDEIIAHERELPFIAEQKKDIRYEKYIVLQISELDDKYPFINWTMLFSLLADQPVNPKNVVHIYFFEKYFENLLKSLNQTQNWVVNNVLLAMFAEELYTNLVLPKKIEDTEKYCVQYTSKLLKDVSSAMYMSSWPESSITSAQVQLNKTFDSLKTNLETLMEEAEWLDDYSKNSLNDKTKNIDLFYDDDFDIWMNEPLLNDRVKGIEESLVFQNQILLSAGRHRRFYYNLWGQSALNSSNILWLYSVPYNTKPISIYTLDLVVAPIGMALNLPNNIPQYIKITQLDYPLAKAIGHQFDSTRMKETKLSQDARTTFDSTKTCGENRYSYKRDRIFDNRMFHYTLDGTLSLNERMAEDIAVKLIEYQMNQPQINDKLLEWISNSHSREKIVFLALAQTHCEKKTLFQELIGMFENEEATPAILVESLISNSEKFSEVYDCSLGLRMNPVVKCHGFPLLELEEYEDPPTYHY